MHINNMVTFYFNFFHSTADQWVAVENTFEVNEIVKIQYKWGGGREKSAKNQKKSVNGKIGNKII